MVTDGPGFETLARRDLSGCVESKNHIVVIVMATPLCVMALVRPPTKEPNVHLAVIVNCCDKTLLELLTRIRT